MKLYLVMYFVVLFMNNYCEWKRDNIILNGVRFYFVLIFFDVNIIVFGEVYVYFEMIRYNWKVVFIFVGNKRFYNKSGNWIFGIIYFDLWI